MTGTTDGQPGDDRFAAFRHGSYLRFWLARFFVTFSTQIVSVAVGWQIYDLTRDPFDLGLVGLVQFAPSLLLVLVTGASADRFGRRLVMGLATLLEALCALALLVLAWNGLTTPVPIFVILALFGIARAFFAPASSALVANLVPPRDFANAVAWNSSAWQTATIVGPVAGGLLYGLSAGAAYGMATVLMVTAAMLILLIPKPAQHTEREPVTLGTIFAGFRYMKRSFWEQSRSISSRCCLAVPLPSFPSTPAMCWNWAHGALACYAQPPAWALSPWRSIWPPARSATMPASSCWAAWLCSASSPPSSASPPCHGCRLRCSPCSVLPT